MSPDREGIEPRRVGDYEVLTELASGGVATVFVARHVGDAGFERLVAIKRVHRHLLRDPDVFASLADEARISALVHHPNVVATHEVLDQRGELCLVQPYVEGVSLALLHKRAGARRDGGLLDVGVVARIAVDLLRGLHAAHEAVDLRGAPLDLVHRDVSPQNVLVGADGVARLIDFGIARAEGRITETRDGILKGKLAYMAPEQIGEKDVDRRADVFAAGVVLFEMLAGVRPFDGHGDAETMARILAAAPDLAPVDARAPLLAPVVARALEREPDARFATAEALAEAVEAAARPATDAAMRALVLELAGDLLDERRASIREELGRADDEALGAAPEAHEMPEMPAAAPPASQRVTARRWGLFGAMTLAAAGTAIAAMAWSSVPQPSASASASPLAVSGDPGAARLDVVRAEPPPQPSSPRATPAAALDTASPASPPSARSSPPRLGASTTRPSASTPPTTSSRPELHGNPYAR